MSFLLETLSSTNFHPPCCLLQAKTSQAFYYHFNQMYKYPIPGKNCSQTPIKASKKPLNSDKLYHPLGSVLGIKTIVVCLIMIAAFHRHFIKELKLSSASHFPHKVACAPLSSAIPQHVSSASKMSLVCTSPLYLHYCMSLL